jgi:hypothetical protein
MLALGQVDKEPPLDLAIAMATPRPATLSVGQSEPLHNPFAMDTIIDSSLQGGTCAVFALGAGVFTGGQTSRWSE